MYSAHRGTFGIEMNELVKDIADFFPYMDVRPFQDQFIETIFNAVEEGRSVAIEGSNGLGKTIAALSACLPRALEKNLKILYVARTYRQHDRVIEELKNISRKQSVARASCTSGSSRRPLIRGR
jgi:DNA excision repair protein ERCC-2